MKKIIIGSLVGAVLLFGWQSLSWTVLQLHESEVKYTPAQDTILNVLNSSITEDGQYGLPNVPPGASHKDMEELGKKMEGKPWALIQYHKTLKSDMTMQIIRGFLISLFCVLLCCVIIGRLGNKTFGSIFATTLYIGIICFLFVWYTGHNWMGTSWGVLKPELIDDLASWGLTGIWLGWWYSRK